MRTVITLLVYYFLTITNSFGQLINFSPSVIIKSQHANSSGLSFVNLTSNSPAATANYKILSVTNNGQVILTPSSPSYWQLSGSNLINTNLGSVQIVNLQVANTTSEVGGTIRWTGTDFEAYTGNNWRSLTGVAAPGIWVSVDGCSATQTCGAVCPTGYINGPNSQNYVCKDQFGTQASTITTSTNGCSACGNSGRLSQCYCIKR